MTLHLRPIEPTPRRRCDTAALANARANVIADARLPRHFKEREQFRLKGETS